MRSDLLSFTLARRLLKARHVPRSGLGSEHEVGNQGCCLLPQSPLSGGQKDEKQIEMHS